MTTITLPVTAYHHDLALCRRYPAIEPEYRALMPQYGIKGIEIARDKIRDAWITCGRKHRLDAGAAERLAKQWCNHLFQSLPKYDVPEMSAADHKLLEAVSYQFWWLYQR